MNPYICTLKKKLFVLALLGGKLITPALGQLTPITLTAASFNQDLVAESGNNPQNVTTAALDGPGNNILYSSAFRTSNSVITSGGLPDNGTFTNSGNTWQLTSYSSNNALFFAPQSVTSSASLYLGTPLPYAQISILGAAGYGPTSVTITLKFTDGSSTNYGNFSILDWFENTPYVVSSLGRINRNSSVSNNNAPSTDPRLYPTTITLNTTDQVKKLSQIIITDNSTNNLATAAFFALSGILTSTLAVNEVNLSGQYQAATNSIHLSWNASGATTGERYDIQRSTDGAGFTGLTSITTDNITDSLFSFTDNSIQSGGSYYYRILGIAPSGEQVYSNLIHVQVAGTPRSYAVTQAGDMLYVNAGTSSDTQPIQYAVYGLGGQEYLRGAATAGSSFAVNLHGLAHGVYAIRLQHPTGSETIEFLH